MNTVDCNRKVLNGTREKILEVAKGLFVDQGFTAVTMADIAEAIGIQKPSLYYFYKSKAHIYCAMMDSIVQRIVPPVVKRLREALNEPGDDLELGRTRLREALREFVAIAIRDGTVVQPRDLMIAKLAVDKGDFHIPPETEELIDEIKSAFLDFFNHFGVKEPEIATDVIMSSTRSYIFSKKHNSTFTEPEVFVDYLSGIIMK